MKNQNLKLNKTKLIAKLMIVVILLTSTMTLASCGGPNIFGYYNAQRSGSYYSHKEFQNFIEKYNSKNDGFAATFVSFDLDSNAIVGEKHYEWFIVANLNKYIDDMIFDKYQDYLGIGMTFYINELNKGQEVIGNAYQIWCLYATRVLDYNFDENDSITLSVLEDLEYRPSFNKIYNPYDKVYNYINTYVLNINGIEFMKISISALDKEISSEKLDEITQLLMDNIVIINTEG